MEAYRIFVSGRVQGVGYRWFAEQEASVLSLTGYVRNLTDGRVEVLAQGTKSGLTALCRLLEQGPTMARVINIEVTDEAPDRSLTSFSVLI